MAAKLFRAAFGGLFLSALISAVVAEQGMVLQTHNVEQYGDGSMVIRFLSNNDSVTLVSSTAVYGPCFSPDGNRIAYPYNRKMLYTMDVNGKNKVPLCSLCTTPYSKEPYTSWCTNGYIYWSQCDRNIYRVKADGSMKMAEIVYTASRSCQPQNVPQDCRNIHNLQVDNAGKRAVWTKPPYCKTAPDCGAWSNSIIYLDSLPLTEIDWTIGCQDCISPNGRLATRSLWDHNTWYIMKFGPTTSAGWDDCKDAATCDNFIFKGVNPVPNVKHYMMRWSRNDSTKILFTTENAPYYGYLYDWVAKSTPIKIGAGFVWDYYKQEIHNPSAVAPPAGTSLLRDESSARFLRAADGSLRVQALVRGVLTVSGLRGELISRREVAPAAMVAVPGAGGCRMVRFTSDAGTVHIVWKGPMTTVVR